MISPFKAIIGDSYKAVEARLLAAIHLRFGLPAVSAGGPDRTDQGRRPRRRLSRGDPARGLLRRRGEAILRQAAEILRRDRARLPHALAGRNRRAALPGAIRASSRAHDASRRGSSPYILRDIEADPMIHVCSLARLYETVEEHRRPPRRHAAARRPTGCSGRKAVAAESSHPRHGRHRRANGRLFHPRRARRRELIDFVRGWDRATPLVVHCYAGISRSTAGAFVDGLRAQSRPQRAAIARAIRAASPTATPNARIVSIADRAARPRRSHDRGDRADRPRRHRLCGRPVPARSGLKRFARRWAQT